MDEDEMRAVFRSNLQSHHARSTSSVGSDSSASVTASPPNSPPPQHHPELHPPSVPVEDDPYIASSDADTVEPEDYHPQTPPPRPVSNPAPSTGALALRGTAEPSQQPSCDSPASSASTVPPPSPAVLARFQLASSAPAQQAAVVEVDERGIDGFEDDEERKINTQHSACPFPKFGARKFRLVDEHVSDDVVLSDRGGAAVLPKEIARFLSEYQRDGVVFLYRLWERGRGGLLADAMGLGKTVQTICFLAAAFDKWSNTADRTARILIVAPASLGDNWKKEISIWSPFRVALHKTNEEPIIGRALRYNEVDIVVASDAAVGKEGGASGEAHSWFRGPISGDSEFQWDVVIVDEIHVAKSKSTNIFKALKSLPKRVAFGLTGTAVQNRLMELWNVMSLVVPERLWPDEKSFRKNYADVINRGTKKDASEYMRRRARERICALRKLLAKHMLRRPKSTIQDHLPGKTDYCVLMRMKKDGLQGYMYQRFQNSYDVKLLRDAKDSCDCGSGLLSKECCHRYPNTRENLRNAPIWKMHHRDLQPCERCPSCICLYVQHYSRLLSAHALLILPEDNEMDREKAEFRRELFKYYLGNRASRALEPLHDLEQDTDISCKLNVALKLLRSYEAAGHKTIIFYESLRLGEILRHWAVNKGLMHEVIDGSVNKGERQGAVDRFNANSTVPFFFISKRAGATGLNISAADRVLIFEPCWNPTLDLQAGDRAHRLGQKRIVHIIRLVVENTVEHYVFKTAITKSQVSSAILDNTKEEWRIREDEIGSMHAMLRMGDVFAKPEARRDDFQVVQAMQLNASDRLQTQSSDEAGEHRIGESRKREGSSGSEEKLDVFGDEVIGSLEVEVDNGCDELASPREEAAEFDGLRSRDHCEIPDSQLETDMVLEQEGAAGKLVVTSTSARKKKRQLMGSNEEQHDAGINPNGVNFINFDDASIGDMPVSQDHDFELHGDYSPEKRRALRPSSRKRSRPSESHFGEKKESKQSKAKLTREKKIIELSSESDEAMTPTNPGRRSRNAKNLAVLRAKEREEASDRMPTRENKRRRPELEHTIRRRAPKLSEGVPAKGSKRATAKEEVATRKERKATSRPAVSAFAARARVRK
eukprot:GFKZ01011636.1.p1 GENE.GFKZ01011636.1~~GFKZ01011636.1.p1  ORF type:complete len:1108 (-),score=168.46 GFKZ01011636.1:2227-5550(-)